MSYLNTNDHSKWGYSDNVLCIGDINRTESQTKRSGSVMCFKNKEIAKEVAKFPSSVDKCSKGSAKFLE